MIYKKIVVLSTKFHVWLRYQSHCRKGAKIRNISLHNACHKVLLPEIKLLRKLRKHEVIIINDQRENKSVSAIYACTHIGGFDIEILFEAIKNPCYLFLADPREIYINFDGLLLWLNGVICFESNNKADKKIAKEKAIQLLKNGGSLMIFPEGAWNIYESLPVMPLWWGTADIAIESKTPIVPVAIEKYGNRYFVNIGKMIENDEIKEINKTLLTNKLRDELAPLKWEIWVEQGEFTREGLKDSRAGFLSQMFDEKNTSVTIEDVLKCRYYPDNTKKEE